MFLKHMNILMSKNIQDHRSPKEKNGEMLLRISLGFLMKCTITYQLLPGLCYSNSL